MLDAEVQVHCTNNGRVVIGHILQYRHQDFIQVALNTVKVSLIYNKQFDEYVGSMSGLEMIIKTNELPKWQEYK